MVWDGLEMAAVSSGDRTEWPWISLVFSSLETEVRTLVQNTDVLLSYLMSSALAHSSGHHSWSVSILMQRTTGVTFG